MQRWNIPTDWPERVDAKNGCHLSSCHVYSQELCSLKYQVYFWYFLLMATKYQSQLGQNILSASERSSLALLENAMDH